MITRGEPVSIRYFILFHALFFWSALLAVPKLAGSSSVMPSSTWIAVLLNSDIVSPIGCSTRGCHPFGMRSSKRNGRKSLILPPKIVSSVDELKS